MKITNHPSLLFTMLLVCAPQPAHAESFFASLWAKITAAANTVIGLFKTQEQLDQALFDAVAHKKEFDHHDPDRFKKLFDDNGQRHTKVVTAIQQGANLNYRTTQSGPLNGYTPPFVEASRPMPDLEIIQTLLDADANPEQEILPIPVGHPPIGHTPYYAAVKNNASAEALTLMLTKYDSLGQPSQNCYNDYDTIPLSALMPILSKNMGLYKTKKYSYYTDPYPQHETSLLVLATRAHKTAMVQALLEASIKKRNNFYWHGCHETNHETGTEHSPLYVAAEHGFLDITELLIAHNGKYYVDAYKEQFFSCADYDIIDGEHRIRGENPLEKAINNGHIQVARLILKGWITAAQPTNAFSTIYNLSQTLSALLQKDDSHCENRLLFEDFLQVDVLTIQNQNTHLHCAIEHGNAYFLEKIIAAIQHDYDSVPVENNKDGHTPPCLVWLNKKISEQQQRHLCQLLYNAEIKECQKCRSQAVKKYRDWIEPFLKECLVETPVALLNIILEYAIEKNTKKDIEEKNDLLETPPPKTTPEHIRQQREQRRTESLDAPEYQKHTLTDTFMADESLILTPATRALLVDDSNLG